jgi:hypothetical protein
MRLEVACAFASSLIVHTASTQQQYKLRILIYFTAKAHVSRYFVCDRPHISIALVLHWYRIGLDLALLWPCIGLALVLHWCAKNEIPIMLVWYHDWYAICDFQGTRSIFEWLGLRLRMVGGTRPLVPNPQCSPKNPRPLDQNDHTGQLGRKNAQTYKHMVRVRFMRGASVRFRTFCATIRCAHGDRGAGISTCPITASTAR